MDYEKIIEDARNKGGIHDAMLALQDKEGYLTEAAIMALSKAYDMFPSQVYETASCRICIVEVEGMRAFQPSCATKIREGMVVNTDTEAVRNARKSILELILADHAVDCHHCLRIGSSKCDDLDPVFCEMCFWCDCPRDGFCELQILAREYKVDMLPYDINADKYEVDKSLGSIIRNPNKCIKCRRCIDVCGEVQTVHNLGIMNRSSEIKVVPELDKPMAESTCVRCGRCANVCPT